MTASVVESASLFYGASGRIIDYFGHPVLFSDGFTERSLDLPDIAAIKRPQTIVSISLLAKLLEDRGFSALPLLKSAHIKPAMLADPKAKISLRQEVDFVRATLAAINDPDIGFHAGQCYRLNAFGSLGLAVASSEKVSDAIEFFLRYLCLSNTHFDISFFRENGMAVLRFKDQYDLEELRCFYIERDFSFALISTRDMFPRTLVGKTVKIINFDFACPTTVESYEALYGCPVNFSMPYNEFQFDQKYLRQVLPQANSLARKLFEEQCEAEKVKAFGPEGFVQKIRQEIRGSENTIPNMEDIANQFHTTSRTVRRKLKAEGLTYQGLLSEELCRKATHYLETTNLTVEQITQRLGYGESASFIHAFKRWTGKTPKAYRSKM